MPAASPRPQKLALSLALAFALGLPTYGMADDQNDDNDRDDQEQVEELDQVEVKGQMGRYSALKSDTPIMETARSVDVIDAEEISNRGALNLADTYLYSAGVFGETYGFATRGDWVRVRGLDVPEYRDSLQAIFGSYNNARSHIYTLEQVEILKGPASVLYGQGSPGGIVNVVSKTPRDDLRPEIQVQLGTDNYKQIATDFGGRLDANGDWLYRMVAVVRDADTQIDHVKDDQLVLAPSLTWRPTAMTNITVLGNYTDIDSQAGAQFLPIQGTLMPAPNGQFIDNEVFLGEPGFDQYQTETRSVTLLADHAFNATWSMEATARWTDGEADYDQAWPTFINLPSGESYRYIYNADGSLYENGTVPRTFYKADSSSEQYAADVRLRAEFHHGEVKHEVLMGAQYQDVTTDQDSAYIAALGLDTATLRPDSQFGDTFWINVFDPQYGNIPPQEVFDAYYYDAPESMTTDRGLYISDQLSWNNWRFTVGGRFDDVSNESASNEQSDDAFSLSAGALYRFDNGVSPYLSYAESFEPVVGTDSITDEPLKPQEGEQIEAGIKYQPPGSRTQITLNYFEIEQSNLSNPAALDGVASSQQEGVSSIDGVEFSANTYWGDFLAKINLSELDTENPNGFTLATVPERQASGWFGWEPGNTGPRAGFGVRYVGESWDGTDTIRTPSYTVYDLMVGYETQDWTLQLNALNLFDKSYQATCLSRGDCFPGETRSVTGTLTYKF